MGHSAVHEHLQTLRRWYKVKRREAPPSQPTCSSGALRSVGCFGCANSRLSSVIAQKQMCAKYRTLPFDAALLRLITLNDLRFKWQRSKAGNVKFYFSRFCQEFAFIASGPCILPLRTALIPRTWQIASASAFRSAFSVSSTDCRTSPSRCVRISFSSILIAPEIAFSFSCAAFFHGLFPSLLITV